MTPRWIHPRRLFALVLAHIVLGCALTVLDAWLSFLTRLPQSGENRLPGS